MLQRMQTVSNREVVVVYNEFITMMFCISNKNMILDFLPQKFLKSTI